MNRFSQSTFNRPASFEPLQYCVLTDTQEMRPLREALSFLVERQVMRPPRPSVPSRSQSSFGRPAEIVDSVQNRLIPYPFDLAPLGKRKCLPIYGRRMTVTPIVCLVNQRRPVAVEGAIGAIVVSSINGGSVRSWTHILLEFSKGGKPCGTYDNSSPAITRIGLAYVIVASLLHPVPYHVQGIVMTSHGATMFLVPLRCHLTVQTPTTLGMSVSEVNLRNNLCLTAIAAAEQLRVALTGVTVGENRETPVPLTDQIEFVRHDEPQTLNLNIGTTHTRWCHMAFGMSRKILRKAA